MSHEVAVVTGGSSGIGRRILEELEEVGYRAVCFDRAERELTQAGDGDSGEAFFLVDVTDAGGVRDAWAQMVSEVGPPSVLVNCAGWERASWFIDTDEEFWRELVEINFLGVVRMTQLFLRSAIDAGVHGCVINIASEAARVGSAREAVYSGCKAGVIGFGKSVAREVARYGIRVNTVCPGPVETKLYFDQPEEVRSKMVGAIPLRRVGVPADIAGAVAFLVSEKADFITGQTLSVSGGLTMA